MGYLDTFILETIRMLSVAPTVITRQSAEDFHIRDFGAVPVDMTMSVDICNLYFNPYLCGWSIGAIRVSSRTLWYQRAFDALATNCNSGNEPIAGALAKKSTL